MRPFFAVSRWVAVTDSSAPASSLRRKTAPRRRWPSFRSWRPGVVADSLQKFTSAAPRCGFYRNRCITKRVFAAVRNPSIPIAVIAHGAV